MTTNTSIFDTSRDVFSVIVDHLNPTDRAMLRRTSKPFHDQPDLAGTPLNKLYASRYFSSVAMLKWAVSEGLPLDVRSFKMIAATGHVEVMMWALAEHALNFRVRFMWLSVCMGSAAETGQLEMCKWLLERAHADHRENGLAYMSMHGASRGQMAVVRWTVSEGFPLGSMAIGVAVAGGCLNVLRWALKQGYYQMKDLACNKTFAFAVNGGQVEMLEWIVENFKDEDTVNFGSPWGPVTSRSGRIACDLAAWAGQLKVLQWARDKGCPWTSVTAWEAAKEGHLDVLRWAWENGCPHDELACAKAALGGHLDVLRWAWENEFVWDEETCAMAATSGHLKVLQWARERDCPWNEWTCDAAAEGGHLEVLKWARQHGCPWDSQTCIAAAANHHVEVLRWARENGCPWNLGEYLPPL